MTLPFQIGVTPGDDLALLLPVVRPASLPREVALSAFQAFAFIEKVKQSDRCAVGVVGVLEYPYVDTDALLGRLQLLRWVVGCLNIKYSEPFSGRFAFNRYSLDVNVL
ncbi:hypothetical protein SAMN05421858_3776 [Haladaptatus litoreus]|uniref:Uncharacterized protein n=1 Tax=Haladaptatus litoreus TaxID=553468 RepID=A0A1N7DNR2_9EURY|nr:hypothetical protein SAMN05421858_3776 [Haladaptatus litoreus]